MIELLLLLRIDLLMGGLLQLFITAQLLNKYMNLLNMLNVNYNVDTIVYFI